MKQAPMKLWYTMPAPDIVDSDRHHRDEGTMAGWEKWSLPLGNSYFGASVFGRVVTERINITENSLANPGLWGKPWRLGNGGTQTFGDIYLETDHGEYEDYVRDLVLDDATAHVAYTASGVRYEREHFVSYPDRVMAVKLTASEKGKLSFRCRLHIPFIKDYCIDEGDGCGRTGEVYAAEDRLIMRGLSIYYQIIYEGQAKVQTIGGTVAYTEEGIVVENADEAVLYFTCGTNYKMEARVFSETEPKKKLTPYADPHAALSARLDRAVEKGYDALRAAHVADYKALYDRVALNVGCDEKDLLIPTNEVLSTYKKEGRSAYLETLYYQYGRYLLIASSRPGGYPANLQGTWTAYDSSPWGADYHHNINVQMNYWPSGIANLAECFVPYIDYAKAYMPSATEHADAYIRKLHPDKAGADGENGWAIGTAAFLYYVSSPAPGGHSGPGTGAFTSLLFWDYYTFTGDQEYLREVGYPFLREMSRFLSKTLIEVDGKLLVRDSASPEQQLADGSYYKTVGCAFDQQMIYENHKRVLEAAEILGIPDDELLSLIRWQLPRLDPVQIGLDGQIKEFREEEHYGDIGEYTHRHISQLVGLYPATIINKNTPEWLEGAKISLTERSDKSTGWAAAHRLCAWARTGMGNRAYDLYYSMLKNNTLPNLWDTHPPFQIDGNFGAVAGISEMLLQSQAGFIDFLPSLPDVWTDGSFDGLVARGDFVCGCDFAEKKPTEIRIHARSGGACRVRLADIASKEIPCAFSVISPDEVELQMARGERVSIKI